MISGLRDELLGQGAAGLCGGGAAAPGDLAERLGHGTAGMTPVTPECAR